MNKRKSLIIGGIVAVLMIISGIVFAATTLGNERNYAFNVINDGSGNDAITSDDNIQLQTKILKNESTATELTVETSLKSLVSSKNKKIALVIDSSYSMEENAGTYDIKQTAKNIADSILDEIPAEYHPSISIIDNNGVRLGFNNNKNTIDTNIDGITFNSSNDISTAITNGVNNLGTNNNEDKYLIVISDATDNAREALNDASTKGIKVYTVLADITSTSFGNQSNPIPSDGTMYLMNNFNENDLVEDINKAVKNVSLTAKLDEDIIRTATTGNCTLEIDTNNTDGTATQNSDGSLDWQLDSIKAGQTKKLTYKLKLKTNKTIDSDSLYNDINLIKEAQVAYIPYGETQTATLSTNGPMAPIVQLADAYDLIIKAVGEGTDMPVEGAKFNVTGEDEQGNVVIDEQNLVTDSNGNVTIKTVIPKGRLKFIIQPVINNLVGYESSDTQTLFVTNNYSSEGGEFGISYYDTDKVTTDNEPGHRKVTVQVPIKLQKFKIKIDVSDLSYPTTKLPGVDFRLIQPKLNNIYEMDALYGTTDNDGIIEFDASIMSSADTYEYILSQTSDITGYENIGNATVKIKFDSNGKVVENGVQTLYNSNVSGERISEDEVLIRVHEKCNSSDMFTMNITLKDEDTNEPIEGTIYEITVTKTSNTGNETINYTNMVTDENGNINFRAMASEEGKPTQIQIHELTPNSNYIQNSDKQIIIKRENGIISEVLLGKDYAKPDEEHNNKNELLVNLTSKKKSELNIIRMHLTQSDDIDMNLINVPMELKDVTPNGVHNGQVYHATTNGDGFADFTLEDPATIQDGTYYFEITVPTVPQGYIEPDVVGTIRVNVQNGRIIDASDATGAGHYMPLQVTTTVEVEVKDTTVSNIAYADYVLTPDANSTSYLKIKLLDKDNGTPVANGKYQITMERDSAQIANAGATGKYTGTDGYTRKMSIPGLDREPVTITIAQVYDATRQTGYKVDPRIYTIVVHKENDGNIQIDSATLQDGTQLPVGVSASYEDTNNDNLVDTVVFNHVNEIINPGDIIVDFSVVKYDWTTKEPCQTQNIIMWSDDFVIYDKDNYEYEQFTASNPYNPFKTGNINNVSSADPSQPVTISTSTGQVDIRIKPINLPEVLDMNRDGYPTGEATIHIGEWDNANSCIVEGTEYEIGINFVYSKETGTYKISGRSNLTNYSLLKDFHWSVSENSPEGYKENAVVELWSNYGQTANFGIDFSKYNFLGEDLVGAKYNVKMILPTGAYVDLAQYVLNGDDTIEIPSIYVKEGAILTISEIEAPIGYEVDTQEASFIINRIDSNTGVATVSDYGVPNRRITRDGGYVKKSGNDFKYIQKIKLQDLELNNTKFGITTKNKDTQEPTQGNSYQFVTNTGSSALSALTNEEGKVTTLIGGEKQNDYMEYTINQKLSDGTSVAQYYKRLKNDIHVKVYFDDNGNIDNDPTSPNYYGTLCSSVDSNYGTTWYIDSVNDDNRINIVILQEREDPLNINFRTLDAFTNAELTGISKYEVTPTVVLDGLENGTKQTQVGFVDPGKTVTYTVKSTIEENYISIPEQQFVVTYDNNGYITSASAAPGSTHLNVEKTGNQTVKVTVTIEPAVPFAIYNTDFYTGAKLQNAEFEIERSDGVKAINKTTNSNGNAVLYDGEFGKGDENGNQTYIYNVKQNTAALTYATVEEFKIYVEYNSNREIVTAGIYGNGTDSTNKFISVHKHATCSSADVGFNGNTKGIVDIEVKNYPAFNIEFTNVDRINNNIKLQGAKFDIVSSIDRYPITDTSDPKEKIQASTNGTNVDGVEMAYVDRTLFGKTVTYEITNTESANEYQKIRSKIKLEVDFDENGYINIAGSNPVRIIEGSDYAEVQLYNPATTNAENFGIKLTVKSSPEFRINIDNIDRADYNNSITTNLAGAEYSITSDYNTSVDVVKPTTDPVVAMLKETPINGYVTYTIKETKPAVGYQTIEKDILMKVHFDTNGCIDDVQFTDSKNNAYATANRAVTNVDTTDTYKNFTIDLSIRNNPLIALNINKTAEDGTKLNNVKFNIQAKVKNSEDVIFEEDVTTLSGVGAFKLDRALDNTTIVYTIKETKNTPGYEYIPSDLTLEVTYDNVGKIISNSVQLTPQVPWATLGTISDYGIELNVINDRIKEIGVNLNTIDKYDDDKLAEQAEIKAYFTKENVTFNEDTDHSATLITGRDDDGDGNPDTYHGNDYQTLGKAENITKSNDIAEKPTATLVLKEIKTPTTYYDKVSNTSKDNIYMSWSEQYALSSARIDLTFTDEGKIETATLVTDSVGTTALGKLLDDQYIKVTIDPSNPYMLNVELRYYPMLELTVNAVSDDTYSRATDKEDNDLIGTYLVKSQHYLDIISSYYDENTNMRNGLVKAGYVGNSSVGGIVPNAKKEDSKLLNTNTNDYEANTYGLWAGEQYNINNSVDIANNGRIRYVYIYEPNNEQKSEPADNYEGYKQLQYQQHGQQDNSPMYMSYNNHLIAAVQVTYDIKGEIIDAKKLSDKGAMSRIIRGSEEETKNGEYYDLEISDNKHGIIVTPKYKRTTTIETKVTDNITGAELNNITLSPFKGETNNTNDNYTYDTYKRRNLAAGQNKWTYWGGNEANGSNRYVIGTEYNSSQYNGYENIGDVELDIHYDEYGYVDINTSKVLSTNSNGEPNAVIESVDKDTIKLNIIASRKFDIQIDKKDKYDTSRTLSDARFSILSSKTDIRDNEGNILNVKENIEQGKRTQVGLMHKGNVVSYAVSESYTPDRYYTIDTFKLRVSFDDNGVINTVKLVEKDNENVVLDTLYDSVFGIHSTSKAPIKLISVAPKYNELKPQDITDLRFELYDTPRFETNITLKDQFYKDEPIEGVTYSIKNDTYNVSAEGNPITDANGEIHTSVGTVYPGETVQYTIRQTNTANGYYAKNSNIVLKVTFDDRGYVEDYIVLQGDDEQSEISLDTEKRGLNLIIYNKPKDMKIGIEKFDKLDNTKLEGVEFEITREQVGSNGTTTFKDTTSADGDITRVADSYTNEKEMIYTIKETKQLDAYRAIGDIVIRVKYNADGSIDYYNVDSNPSNVDIIVANNKFETLANGDKVHIKLLIPNDDTYDLIVRDEDKDIANLGIEGTIYNVAIKGVDVSTETPPITDAQRKTDSSGYMSIVNRKENGTFTIKVSEAQIGTGYRENESNSAELTFDKGLQPYSLDLNTAALASKGYTLVSGPVDNYDSDYKNGVLYTIKLNNNAELILGIYEDTGKIVYTFKNESKQMLNLRKIDSETGAMLEGAVFEVTSQEVDAYGNVQGTPTTITSNLTTDDEGKASFDMKARPESKKIKYTFREVTPPSGYIGIEDVSVICTYDESGKITNKEKDSKRIGTDGSWYDLNTTIKNGDMETYSVKVISIDSRKGSTSTGLSNNRINDSEFTVVVRDQNGNQIAGTQNDEKLITSRIPDSFGYPEDGIITINGLKAEGTVSVEVAQTAIADGFIEGNNQVAGTVTFENEFVPDANNKPIITLSNLNDGGFIDSYIDENENQIVIKVYNDPIVKLNLHKEDIDTNEPIEGATFTITSEIDGKNRRATVPTDLNVTTEGTNAEGNELVAIGAPEYGKTVIYTIHENALKDYEEIEDAKIKVTYDSNGKINNWEVLGDELVTEVKEKIININGVKEDWTTYTDEEFTGLASNQFNKVIYTQGTRKLNTVIRNKATEKPIPYTIIIETVDSSQMPIEGISLNLNLKQGKGGNPIYPSKTTNADGQVMYSANGSDLLEMEIEILNSKEYTFNDNLKAVAFKNSTTGVINHQDQNNVDVVPTSDPHVIHLRVAAGIADNKYGITLLKMDKSSNMTLVDNPATFTITRVEDLDEPEDETEDLPDDAQGADQYIDDSAVTSIEHTLVNKRETNESGILGTGDIDMPKDIGTYTYKIYEDKAPTGYKPLEEPVEVEITFGLNEDNEKIITNVVSKDESKVYLIKLVNGKGVVLCVNNIEDVPEDEIMLNIFKIDNETKEKLNGAIFKVKLPDENNTSVYTESGENADMDGQFDYCYIEQEKDYEVRLKHMPRPTVEEVKAEPDEILTHVYTFQEIAAPEGYALDRTVFNLTIPYIVRTNDDGTETVVIKTDGVQSSNHDLLEVYSIDEDQIGANILNKEDNVKQAYEVTYDANTLDTVTDVPDPQLKTPTVALTLDARIPQRSGFKFKEWNTDANGTGTGFPAGGTYGLDSDITLYAIWDVAEYTITYHDNAPIDPETRVAVGLVDNMPYAPDCTQTKTHDEDITLDDDGIDPVIPNVADYFEFVGWNTKPDGSGRHYDVGEGYTDNADLDLYAEWNYKIHYDANLPTDGDGFAITTAQNMPQDQSDKVTSTEDLVIDDLSIYSDAPTADGYVFKEWNTKPDGTGDPYMPDARYEARKGIVLYAIWEYEITYDENKPLDENNFPINATISNIPETQKELVNTAMNISAQEPTIEPEDYLFKEWNTKPDGTGYTYNPNDPYAGATSVKLYAIWETVDKLYLKLTDDSKYEIGEGNTREYEQGDKYISYLRPEFNLNRSGTDVHKGTTVNEFISNLRTNASDIEVKTKDGIIISGEDLIGTGASLTLIKGNESIEVKLSVIGDLSGDGKILADDQAELLQAYRKKTNLNQYFIDKFTGNSLNLDPEILIISSDLTEDKKGAQVDDVSIMTLIRGYKTDNAGSGIQTLKLW